MSLIDRRNLPNALTVLRLVLASGSLKSLAGSYGVSYPTIRVRLDRLIEHLRSLTEGKAADPMANLLADLVGCAVVDGQGVGPTANVDAQS